MRIIILLMISIACLAPPSAQAQRSDCLLSKNYEIKPWIQPNSISGDFDADGVPDKAELVRQRKTGKKGIAVCCSKSKRTYFLGAGTEMGAGSDDFDWMNHWELFPRDSLQGFEEIGAKLTPRDSLHVEVQSGPGGIIYFDKDKFNWIQFGE